jgi:phospholipase C
MLTHIRLEKSLRKYCGCIRVTLASGISGAILTALASSSLAAGPQTPTQTPIKHVVVIFNENNSFDHYFGTYPVAANPGGGEPVFEAGEYTPTVNGLISAGLLTNNPNLTLPYRLDRSEAYTCDMDHDYTDEQKAVDGGLMDKFVQATADIGLGCRNDGSTVMAYFDGNTVTGLWNYAQRYAMNDNSYGSMYGPSTVGAVNLVSGRTSFAVIATAFSAPGVIGATSPLTTITGDPDPALDDCGADVGGTKKGQGTVEITSGKNIGDLLNAKGVTWGWFQGGFKPTQGAAGGSPAICGSAHIQHQYTPPGGTQPVLVVPNPSAVDGGNGTDIHTATADYVPHHDPFQYYPSTRNPHHLRPSPDVPSQIGKSDQANHQYDISDFFAALQTGNLPAVSYIKPPKYQNAHPGNSDPLLEQIFVVNLINALQASYYWRDTAVIINYDDSDGWYDHVLGPAVNHSENAAGNDNATVGASDSLVPTLPLSTSTTPADPALITTSGVCGPAPVGAPPGAGRCGYGPRLPFLVISPWAKRNYVDHTITDQTSSLRFIELNWDLGFIDGTTLAEGQPLGSLSFDQLAGSIEGMFDFNQPDLEPLFLDPLTGKRSF